MSLNICPDWNDKMNTPKIQYVKPLTNKRLLVLFNNGAQKLYDCHQILHLPGFRWLQDDAFFKTVMVDIGGYGISWNDETDLSEYELWHHGFELKAEDALLIQDSELAQAIQEARREFQQGVCQPATVNEIMNELRIG
jgi:hypothetical protein